MNLKIDHTDRVILHYLIIHKKVWHNTNEIADNTKISWATAREHLEHLTDKGYVIKGQKGKTILWKVNL